MVYYKFYCRFCDIYAFDYHPIGDQRSKGGINYHKINSWTEHLTKHMPWMRYEDAVYPRDFVRMYRLGEKVIRRK